MIDTEAGVNTAVANQNRRRLKRITTKYFAVSSKRHLGHPVCVTKVSAVRPFVGLTALLP